MSSLLLLMFLLSGLTGQYSPYSVKILPGVHGNKEGYYIKINSDREEFISRKQGNRMFSIVEYRIMIFKKKEFFGGDIYIDTLENGNNNFSKTIFFPSSLDSVDMKVVIKDRLSGKFFEVTKFVAKGYKGNKNVRVYPPLLFDENNEIPTDYKTAKRLRIVILNKKNKKYGYHVDLVGDTILVDKSGTLNMGYNFTEIELTKNMIDVSKQIEISIKDSDNFAVSFPLSVVDTEETETYLEMVDELVYIATPAEIRKLKNASRENRDSLWNAFWKKRDPVPTTEKNEAEIEYFKRVKYANEHFTSYKPGWKTDRGMIYIKYGPPDDIESFPYNIDSEPYEIWYYNELHKRFVFIDKYGWGDYQLVY